MKVVHPSDDVDEREMIQVMKNTQIEAASDIRDGEIQHLPGIWRGV